MTEAAALAAPAPHFTIAGMQLMQREAPRDQQPLIVAPGQKPVKQWVLVLDMAVQGRAATHARFQIGELTEGQNADDLARILVAVAAAILNPQPEQLAANDASKQPEQPAAAPLDTPREAP